MKSLLVRVVFCSLIAGLTAANPVTAVPLTAEIPDALEQRQQQLFKALEKVRGTIVGVSDGMGVGSGVVVSGDGIVLTASHVVDPGRGMIRGRRRIVPDHSVTITFPDGKRYPASILGKNRDADAAVLKMTEMPEDGSGFPHAEMGRTTETSVGEWCFALGHPGGFRPDREAPVRIGRVLSVGNRTVVSDCAILLGDSGGPLFDMDGKVIGVHSMITSLIIENRHVAIDSYHDNWDRLVAGERWGRLRSSDNSLAESGFFGVQLKWKEFVPEISRVLPNTPADKAGLKKGDILLTIEDEPIADRLDLGTTLDLLQEEQSIEVGIRRNGQPETVALVTGDDSSPHDDEDDEENGKSRSTASQDDQDREKEIMEQLSESRQIGRFEKRTAEEMAHFDPITAAHRNNVVAIRDGGLLLCLGTVMSKDGYILTKASEMSGAIDPEVILPNGRRFPAQELASDHSFDLMLIKVDANNLEPVDLRTDAVQPGQLALLQDAKGNALLPTVISVAAHSMESARKAFLGIEMAEDENGVRIARVIPGGAADRNGLKEGDIVMSIAGLDVHHTEELRMKIGEFSPGDKISLRYMRGDSILTMNLVLTSRFMNENPLLPLYNNPEFMGQFASTHAGGFPRALQIDADVYPTKVGGPLLDLEGRTLGIVIARADRYPTFAIPSDSVKTVFEELKTEAANKKSE